MPKKEPSKSSSKCWIIGLIVAVAAIGMLVLLFLSLVILSSNDLGEGNVALIELRGAITEDGSGAFGEASASSRDIISFIKEAETSASIKAIVIDINSPGGSAVASDEIAQAIKSAKKPTVALIHEIGTSGAYWVASSTDYIIANRMSMTGSIGVLSSYLEFSQLMEKYGITYEQLTAGKYKDIGTPFRSLSSEERKLLQSKLDRIHNEFITEIAYNRGLSEGQVKQIATGEFFLGSEAKELGLVDELGGAAELEAYLKKAANVTQVEYAYYTAEPTLLDVLSQLASRQFFFVGKGIGKALVEDANFGGVWT